MTDNERFTLEYLINRIEWEKDQHPNSEITKLLDVLISLIKAKLK